jgi:hypothetical protein
VNAGTIDAEGRVNYMRMGCLNSVGDHPIRNRFLMHLPESRKASFWVIRVQQKAVFLWRIHAARVAPEKLASPPACRMFQRRARRR